MDIINAAVCPLCKYPDAELLGKRADFISLDGYKPYVEDINLYDRNIYKCMVCGLQFISPMYSESDLDSLYNSHGYGKFVENHNPCGEDFENIKSKLILEVWKNEFTSLGLLLWKERFQKENHAPPRLLDVGCGMGQRLYLFNNLGFDVKGIDMSDNAVEFVRNKLNLKIEKTSLEDFETDAKFDCILGAHIIEHVTEPHAFMNKLTGLLSQSGMIILETPIAVDHSRIEERYRDIYHTLFFDHFTLALLGGMHGLKYVNSMIKSFTAPVDGANNIVVIASFSYDKRLDSGKISEAWIKTLRNSYYGLYKDSIPWYRHLLSSIEKSRLGKFRYIWHRVKKLKISDLLRAILK